MIIYNGKEYSRAIAIGDIHSTYDELLELLELVQPTNKDLLISVGDLVDRGPKAREVIHLFRQIECAVIKGNHDDRWCRLKINQDREKSEPGYKNKMRPLHPHNQKAFDSLSQEEHDWLKALPDWIKFQVEDQIYYVVHAGFIANIPIEKQDPKITCRLRYVDNKTGYMKTNREDFTKAPPDSVYWTHSWNRPERVIYGHEARDEVDITNNCYGIDTSCTFGGKLTAMIINGDNSIKFQSVKAKKIYWNKNSFNDL